jgi:hypothetical protein
MNKIKYLTLLVTLTAFTSFFPWGKAYAEGTDLTFSLGNICEYVGKIQTTEDGGKNFCGFMPYLASSFDIPLANGFYLAPQIGASLPQSGKDENVKRMTLFALANGKYKINLLTLTAGLGLYFTRIWGPGGEAVLNNGTGTDSFPLPEEPVYTRNFIVNLGVGAQVTKEISGELYTYIFNAAESEDRSFSIGLSATYHFGEVL